ncbi:MAG: M3 family peptidase, partial [Verrucomicrobia bacterium]|nr:M3 family peptidase [Verrucomicrobiota bacterium]
MHPFNDSRFHVRWSTLVPEAVEADVKKGLDEAKSGIDRICELEESSLSYENTFHALENASVTLNRAWGRLEHLDSVADEPAQREAMNKMLPEVSAFYSSIPLNEQLWRVLKAFGTSDAVHGLSVIQRRHVEETMMDFIQSGADLPADKKQRIAGIDAELSQITKQYA